VFDAAAAAAAAACSRWCHQCTAGRSGHAVNLHICISLDLKVHCCSSTAAVVMGSAVYLNLPPFPQAAFPVLHNHYAESGTQADSCHVLHPVQSAQLRHISFCVKFHTAK
jgi:hypothetical protein